MSGRPFAAIGNQVMKCKVLVLLFVAALVGDLRAQSVTTVLATNLFEPHSIATDTNNYVYLSDGANNRIVRYIPSTGTFSSLAGFIGHSGTNNGTGTTARFFQPQGLVAARGGLVVADSANHLIRYVSFSGAVSNLAGIATDIGGNTDGPAATAEFRNPIGLAVDLAGNIFVADSQNGMIRKIDTGNVVSTVTNGLNHPAAVAVGSDGDLWITDTSRHVIKRIDTNGVMTLMAGILNSSGSDDSLDALTAKFASPGGLYWAGTNTGLLISDTGNHTIRRLYYNNDPGVLGYSVETVAGIAGTVGFVNGTPAASTFHSPIGLLRDVVAGGFYVVDSGNNALRRIQTSPPLPPVSNPILGYVIFVPNALGELHSQFNGVTQAVFNNDAIIAIKAENATETYITFGTTPASPFEDNIPSPGPTTGQSPQIYRGDGLSPADTLPTIVAPQPDLTIKAIGLQDGRQPSSVVSARYQFKTANPNIIGDNAAAITLSNITAGAEMWYTTDGSEPTNQAPSVGPELGGDKISFLILTNTTLKVRAFRTNFKPSEVSTKVLSPTNFAANRITFGFAGGEASSDFVAAAGQHFYAPITLSLLAGQTVYSMQFNVTVTNITNGLSILSPPVTPGAFLFQSMLEKPVPATVPQLYIQIPPAMFVAGFFTNLVFTNASENLLGVGWFERFGEGNLYNTAAQDLVSLSRAHDNQFGSGGGKVIVGGYSFLVPNTATNGDQYQIAIGRPSGSEDGISKPVFFQAPTNGTLGGGSLNSIKNVTVASRQYIVGDVAPFRWFNAGDFGDTNLVNNDVLQIFESVVYWSAPTNGYLFLGPPEGSDFFDAMDASDGSTNGIYDGNDTNINSIAFGDGVLAVDDIYVTFRRSLDPNLTWYARYWTNGIRTNVTVPNVTSAKAVARTPSIPRSPHKSASLSLNVAVDDIQATAGTPASIPVVAQLTGDLPVRVMMINVTITPLDGSPMLATGLQFTAVSDLGSPTMTSSQTSNNFAGAWLNSQVVGVGGTNLLGNLTVTLPGNVTSNSFYRVHFDHFSASPNGIALFPTTVQDSFITLSNPNASSLGDGIPDLWRLRHFNSVHALIAAADVDADGDGSSNYSEFVAGTDPMDAASRLKLLIDGPPDVNGLTLRWPSVLNKQYLLENTTDLSGGWTVIASNLVGNGQIQQFIHTNGSSDTQFYRLRVQP